MKILVTGGSGFIGTHLCRALTKQGHQVRVLDLVSPKTIVEGVKYELGDVRDIEKLKSVMDSVQAVYHFAAIVSVPVCQQKPVESHQTNLMATVNVLDAVVNESYRQGRKVKVIFAGSSVVYGASCTETGFCKEDMPMAWPLSFYGAQKLGSEHAIRLYHEHHGVPAVVFRFFNVFGPGQDPKSPYSGVISIFSQRIVDSKSMELHGGGTQTRDFISVHDIVAANVLALNLPDEKSDGVAMNLGTGKSITIKTLAESMLKVSNKSVPLLDAPAREGDVRYSQADIQRAKNLLGWNPSISLEDGLRELLTKK